MTLLGKNHYVTRFISILCPGRYKITLFFWLNVLPPSHSGELKDAYLKGSYPEMNNLYLLRNIEHH